MKNWYLRKRETFAIYITSFLRRWFEYLTLSVQKQLQTDANKCDDNHANNALLSPDDGSLCFKGRVVQLHGIAMYINEMKV